MTTPRIDRLNYGRHWIKLLALALLVGVTLIASKDIAHNLRSVEDWISSHGRLGPVVFIVLVIVFASMFVPETFFAVIAGVLFGVAGGTLVMTLAMLLTAGVNFVVARLLLHDLVSRVLLQRPRLVAIQQAVRSQGVRLQLLLRLTPINQVAVNYVLGASDTRFATFLTGGLGLIPVLFVEVYFGHAARHAALVVGDVNKHSALPLALHLAGLLLCVVVLLYITQIAHKALAVYMPAQAKANNRVDTSTKT